MAKSKFISMISMVLLLIACEENNQSIHEENQPNDFEICIKSDWIQQDLNGQVKSLVEHWHNDLDSLHKGWINKYKFDDEGYITFSSFSDGLDLIKESKFIRNDKKEIVQVEEVNHTTGKHYNLIYLYDGCYVAEISGFQPDDMNRFGKRIFKHDSLGNNIETIEYLDGKFSGKTSTSYEKNGSFDIKSYDYLNEMYHRYVYQTTSDSGKFYSVNMNYRAEDDTNVIDAYDSTFSDFDRFGNTTSTLMYVNGNPYKHKFIYSYDALNNWVRYEDHQDGSLWHTYTRDIVYY